MATGAQGIVTISNGVVEVEFGCWIPFIEGLCAEMCCYASACPCPWKTEHMGFSSVFNVPDPKIISESL